MEPPVQDLKLTPKMAVIIKIFLENTEKPHYGLELMRLTGQPSGTLYPSLAKFERAGWLIGGKEDIDPGKEGRPARRIYRISGAGARAAHYQLAVLSDRYRPPEWKRPRPAIDGLNI